MPLKRRTEVMLVSTSAYILGCALVSYLWRWIDPEIAKLLLLVGSAIVAIPFGIVGGLMISKDWERRSHLVSQQARRPWELPVSPAPMALPIAGLGTMLLILIDKFVG